jgi:hypothetical protein
MVRRRGSHQKSRTLRKLMHLAAGMVRKAAL